MAFYPLSTLILEGFYPFYKRVCDAQKMKSCIVVNSRLPQLQLSTIRDFSHG